MAGGNRPKIDDQEHLRIVGEMLVDLNEAERLLTLIHTRAIALGDDDIIHLLDSELFWKLRTAGDQLREHFDMERVHGGDM
ncbi:MAG: hypothetical protein ACRDI2_20385 [Chloroflexota bacterium]